MEIRRKRTYERMKYRAGRNEKNVDMIDNVFYIDVVVKFLIEDGYLCNQMLSMASLVLSLYNCSFLT